MGALWAPSGRLLGALWAPSGRQHFVPARAYHITFDIEYPLIYNLWLFCDDRVESLTKNAKTSKSNLTMKIAFLTPQKPYAFPRDVR